MASSIACSSASPSKRSRVEQYLLDEEKTDKPTSGVAEKKPKRNGLKKKSKDEVIAEQAAMIATLKSDMQKLNRRLKGGAEGELIYKTAAAEDLRKAREREYRYRIKSKQDEVVKLANLCRHIAEKRARTAELKLVSVQRQLDTHAKLIGELECERDARVDADEYSGAVERLED